VKKSLTPVPPTPQQAHAQFGGSACGDTKWADGLRYGGKAIAGGFSVTGRFARRHRRSGARQLSKPPGRRHSKPDGGACGYSAQGWPNPRAPLTRFQRGLRCHNPTAKCCEEARATPSKNTLPRKGKNPKMTATAQASRARTPGRVLNDCATNFPIGGPPYKPHSMPATTWPINRA